MKLTGFFQTELTEAAQVNAARQTEQRKNNGFDQILNAAEKAAEKKEVVKAKSTPVKKQRTDNRQAQQKPPEKERDSLQNAESKPTAESGSAPQKKEAVKTAPVSPTEKTRSAPDEPSDKVVAQVAEILQIPEETVIQLLNALNLQPADLADPQAVVTLLQAHFQAPSPAALLTVAEFSNAFKAIKDFMANPEITEGETAALPEAAAKGPDFASIVESLTVIHQTAEQTETAASAIGQPQEEAETDIAAEIQEEVLAPQPKTTQSGETEHAKPIDQAPRETAAPLHEKQEAEAEFHEINLNAPAHQTARATESAQTVRAAQPQNINAADVISQIVSRVRVQGGEAFTELRMSLRPENLGDISLRVLTQNGVVTAQFVAESQRIKEIIEAHFSQLENVLREQGINFSELSVSVRQEGESERMNQFAQGRQNSRERARRINGANAAAEESAQPEPTESTGIVNGRMNVVV